MTYYNIATIILVVCLDLIILNLVWRALKGPNQLTELSAAVTSFTFIAVGVVMTFIVLTTAVEAAKLTHAIPGGSYKSYTTQYRYSTVRSKHHKYKPGYKRKHGFGANRPTRKPMRKHP